MQKKVKPLYSDNVYILNTTYQHFFPKYCKGVLRHYYLKVWSLFSTCIFKNMMNNSAWTLTIWWKRKIFIYFIKCYWILNVVFSFKIYFSFTFCSDFDLEATVVKTDKIRGLKQLFTPFSLNWKNFFSKIIISNCHIAHQKNHIKNNSDQTFY